MAKIYLVVATLGRVEPLNELLQSIVDQGSVCNVHVVLVDQNSDARLAPVYNAFTDRIPITWIASMVGLSKARNIGLRVIDVADIVGFPDDDCKYPKGFLSKLYDIFSKTEADFVSVREFDADGETDTRPPRRAGRVKLSNVWRACGSNRTFYRFSAINEIGDFDESLGLGAGTPWEGGEDIDYPIRGIRNELKGYYSPEVNVIHKSSIAGGLGAEAKRVYAYNTAMGRIWRKNGYSFLWLTYQVSRACAGYIISLSVANAAKRRFHLSAIKGRIAGWYSCDSEK